LGSSQAMGINSPRGASAEPLVQAIKEDDAAALAEAVGRYGVDVARPLQDGTTLLHTACQTQAASCVEWLISSGADPGDLDSLSLLTQGVELMGTMNRKQKKKTKKKKASQRVTTVTAAKLSEEELKLFARMHTWLEAKASTAHQLFKEFDHDSSGGLNEHEFVKAMTRIQVPLTEQEVYLVFDCVDVNQNGIIDYKEFTQAVKVFKKRLQSKLAFGR